MKLYHTPASPYSRKVRVVAAELGLADRLEDVRQLPRENTKGFHRKAPLARIPVLETDKGEILFDSPVICEYLDSLSRRRKLYPTRGAARWAALKRQALGDGIMDAAVPWRHETLRPTSEQSQEWIERYRGMVLRTADALQKEARAGGLPAKADIGTIAIGCALAYLDFRFPELNWRKGRAALRRWQEAFAARPSMRNTDPEQG